MKQLTENEKRTLQALIKMYEDTQEYGYIIGGAVYTAKQFKVRNYNHISKPLLELKLIKVDRKKVYNGGTTKWISDIRPTYLTAIKISDESVKLANENSKKTILNKKNKMLIESKMNRHTETVAVRPTENRVKEKPNNETKSRSEFINMFDNIINENKEINLKTAELKKDLIKSNNEKEKLNVIISEYKEKHLESYTTNFLWGLIKIKTKLNYSK